MKIIEVIADAGHHDTVKGIAEQQGVTDIWFGPENEDGRQPVRLLVGPDKRQAVLDALQSVLESSPGSRILVVPVEVALPRPNTEDESGNGDGKKKSALATTREEIFSQVEKGARLDLNFLLLVFLSTIVAAIGLIEDNIAVVIGAMVIAPLLGPNIALALATALGDGALIWESFKAILVGLLLAIFISVVLGMFWPVAIESRELMSRTDVGYSGAALALASGAAAVLSLTTGLPSVLVGVMVAVALLPPAATVGLMLGSGQMQLAMGAALLLAVNIVCVNLAAKLVFLIRGVKPRKWLEIRKARQSLFTYLIFWAISLAVLIVIIYLRHETLLNP